MAGNKAAGNKAAGNKAAGSKAAGNKAAETGLLEAGWQKDRMAGFGGIAAGMTAVRKNRRFL